MRGSSVTAARSCLQPLVSASRYLAVHALPGDPLYFIVDAKSKVKEVYAQTCKIFGQQGMQDCDLFGLAILTDGEYLFVDPESKLSKYAPKNWRSSHTYGLDSSGRPAFILYFRVRYYVDSHLLLRDETTRHHYYLQLRDNVIQHGGGVESWQGQHPLQSGSVYGPLLSLAGLALQADLGDFTEERHCRQGYCKPSDYLPAHMCHEENALAVLAAQHRDNHGVSREQAELSYIREAVFLEAPLNAHLYRLRRSKNEPGPGRVLLAICARGVRVYGDEETPQVFTWNNIGKLGFDRKKFEIRAVDQPGKLTLFSGCDDKSKLLLALCRDTHQFFMSIAPRVSEARRREEEERKVLRDCYMYPVRCKTYTTSTRNSRADQRISLISSTSSNTTSGIVSDRVHSEDEPDAGPVSSGSTGSTEDSLVPMGKSSSVVMTTATTVAATVSADVESPIPPPVHPGVLAEVDSGGSAATGSISGNGTSQCSSTCSTVVASVSSATAGGIGGSTTAALLNAAAAATGRRRGTSVSSSLELGYSHTAQNSVLTSDPMYDRCSKPAKYAVTDLASETSGVYTLHSSEMLDETMGNDSSVQSTTDEASVTSGFYTIHSGLRSETSGSCYSQGNGHDDQDPIYSLCQGEMHEPQQNTDDSSRKTPQKDVAVTIQPDDDEARSRSNSILSVSSFRGDGSDPSGQGPLLSANDLTDLIVGRYPPRKSIGASMDSDCDYVRMPPPPPPPAPPLRSDSERQLPPPPPYPGLVSPQPPVPGPSPPGYGCPRERFEIPPPTPPRNDAITPREPPPPPPPPARIQPPTYPGDKMKPTPVHAPVAALVVGPNNYLDVHATRTGPVLLPYLTPPHQAHHQTLQRQPPLPPPPAVPAPPANVASNTGVAAAVAAPGGMLATVYTSQVARTQIEQYKQQLYSDVDYVMFPLKDPALSKQEYIDAKQGSLLAAMAAYPPPPPYPLQAANKSSVMYRSTPYLPYAGSSLSSLCNKYASNQNLASSLSDTNSSVGGNYLLYGIPSSQYAASTSSLYSGLTCSSVGGGSQTFRKERTYASPPPPLSPPASARHHPHTLQHGFSRTRSHENILKSYDATSASLSSLSLSPSAAKSAKVGSLPQPQMKHRRLPPPPPPPPYDIQPLTQSQSVCLGTNDGKPQLPQQQYQQQKQQSKESQQQQQQTQSQQQSSQDGMLDIKTLREKSRNLDLPLISALCNDRYLLKQTKAFVLPRHPNESGSSATFKSSTRNGTSSNGGTSSSRQKYPVSGLSTTQISKPPRKTANSTHKHPTSSTSGLSKAVGNAYQVNATSVAANDKKNPSRASHS